VPQRLALFAAASITVRDAQRIARSPAEEMRLAA
jgi:hypothetical protein